MNKKTKILILWGVGLVLLGGTIALLVNVMGNNNPNLTTYSNSSLVATTKTNFDFGRASMEGGDVSHNFKLKNNGAEPVKIGRVYTSCACTTAYVIDSSGKKYGKFGMPGHSGLRKSADVEVKPGESVIVEAVFNPAFHGPAGIGLAQRSVYVETNSAKSPKLEFRFQATVTK